MSYTGFAGYHCHSTQLSTQLSLMTTNPNNPAADSPCCPASGADNRSSTSNASGNTSMNVSVNDDNHLQSAMSNATPLSSSSSSSVCTLTSPYESRIISSYPRLGGFYGSSYSDQNSFYPSGANPFYSSFGHPYDLKDPNGNGWGGLPQTTCYPYDPTIYSPYGERYSAMDSAARRKNATRETTNTLKAWLYEHRKNPYPTKGEKIMLAIITKMTLTQVSTWFANARRRLKKENKMTWEPRNKSSDGHDSDDKESCKDADDNSSSNIIADNQCMNGGNKLSVKKEADSISEKSTTITEINANNTNSDSTSYHAKDNIVEKTHSGHLHNGHETKPILSHQINNNSRLLSSHHIKHDSPANMLDNVTNIENIGQRPKIWSLAQTATSESPPYSGKIASVTPTEWAATATLPPGPDGLVSLSDYQRECPQGSRLSTSSLRKCPPTWPEEHCVTNLASSRSSAMQLFTSDAIGSANYLNSNSAKPATSGPPFTGSAHHLHSHHHQHHHPFSASIPHLVHANHDSFSTAYNVATNGMRPIIDSQPCHNLGSDINENRLSNGSISKSNTFLCKVFPEYISSGPDALSLNDNNSERGGSTLSIEDSSMSSSSSPHLESHASNSARHMNGSNSVGFSAFRPMLKR